MSQKEFEKQDEQVIGLVNHTADKARKKKQIAADEAAYSRRRILWTTIQVLSCILVALLFVAALLDPGIVVHLVNIGVLTCGIVAGIAVDRQLRCV